MVLAALVSALVFAVLLARPDGSARNALARGFRIMKGQMKQNIFVTAVAAAGVLAALTGPACARRQGSGPRKSDLPRLTPL